MLSHKLRTALFNSGVYITNFSEYPTGSAPADWTAQYNTSDFSVSVKDVAGSISGKALRWTKTAANRQGFSWDRVPAAADVEILLRARAIEAWAANENSIFAYCRGAGAAGSEAGYRGGAGVDNTSTLWRNSAGKYISGTHTQLGSAPYGPSPNYTVNTWFYTRFRMVGTSLNHKSWYSGAAEPGGWTESLTDSSVSAAGWTGLQQVSANPNVEIDYFACSIARGGTAPITLPVPL